MRSAGVAVSDGFEEAVRTGLSGSRLSLPPKYFYDEVGSALFEAITALPEYYITRTEREILDMHGGDIVRCLAPGVCIVELGAGSAVKTGLLIRELLARGDDVEYVAVDISEEAMRVAAANINSEFPTVRFRGVVDDWFVALERMSRMDSRAKLILFLGSSIGNLDRDEAGRFLTRLRGVMWPNDKVLLGTDLVKPVADLIAAYDDAAGVTAAFNRNILVRVNRALDGDFDVRAFRHEARWNEGKRCIEMHLVAMTKQRVTLRRIGFSVDIAAGASIHTENSHKFTPEDIEAMARAGGLRVSGTWQDASDRFRLDLLEHA